jgi:hypothetical protein
MDVNLQPEPWRCGMYKLNDRMHLAADRLLEMAGRVLGPDADRADRYAYINVMLSQWGDEAGQGPVAGLDLTLRTQLRVACYEHLFGEQPDVDDARPR